MGEYNRESETVHSCVDCGVTNCNKMDRFYPEFCLTTDMDERLLGEVIRLYDDEENKKVTVAAAGVESDIIVRCVAWRRPLSLQSASEQRKLE